jgi:hypothetical protein
LVVWDGHGFANDYDRGHLAVDAVRCADSPRRHPNDPA